MASPRTEQGTAIGGAVPRYSWKTGLTILVVLGLTGWSAWGTEFDLIELLTGAGPRRTLHLRDVPAGYLSSHAQGHQPRHP